MMIKALGVYLHRDILAEISLGLKGLLLSVWIPHIGLTPPKPVLLHQFTPVEELVLCLCHKLSMSVVLHYTVCS